MQQYFSEQDLKILVSKILVANNTSKENADHVAIALTQAQIDGQYGHGLSRVPSYAAQAKVGKIDGYARTEIEQVSEAAIRVNANYGFAYPAMYSAREAITRIASKTGIGIATIYRSHHFGVAGYHAELLAKQGMVALVLSNSPKAIAPWGGFKGVFGTNPIAFAAPRLNEEPLLIDLSLSKVARGKVMVAAKNDEEIPEGWALDVEGNATTNPHDAMAGTMLPMGEAKGAALVLMVEILAAALTGANFAYEASSLFDDKGPAPGLGHTIIAINPATISGGLFNARLEDLLSEILSQKDVRLPGERRLKARRLAKERGIELPEGLYEEVSALQQA